MGQKNKIRLKYRAVGVCIQGKQVLIHQIEGESYWSLPGGKVEFLETSADALQREMLEETGLHAQVGRLLWVSENFFGDDNEPVHELAFYYLISLPGLPGLLGEDGSFYGIEVNHRLFFRFYDIAQLNEIALYPPFLRDGLRALPSHIVHLVQDELSGRKIAP